MVVKTISPSQQASLTGISFNSAVIDTPPAGRQEKIYVIGNYQTDKTITDYIPDLIFSEGQVGAKYGYGSPLHLAAKKLFPENGDVAIVPVNVVPIPDPGAGTAGSGSLAASGGATGDFTFYIIVNEQEIESAASAVKQIANNAQLNPAKPPRSLKIDAWNQSAIPVTITNGMDVTDIGDAIVSAITEAVSTPFTGVNTTGTVALTMKWKGATSNADLAIVDSDGNALTIKDGVTFTLTDISTGTGDADIANALSQLTEEERVTRVINQFSDDTNLDKLQVWGEALRQPEISQIALAYSGYEYPEDGSTGNVDVSAVVSFGDGRRDDSVNIVIPGSFSLAIPTNAQRDTMLKAGISNVAPTGGGVDTYTMWDIWTFYHPVGLNIATDGWRREDTAWTKIGNIADSQEKVFRLGDQYAAVVLVGENDATTNEAGRKISDFKATQFGLFDAYVDKLWMTDSAYAKLNSAFEFDDTNPNRVNMNLAVKIPGVGRIYDIVLQLQMAIGQN